MKQEVIEIDGVKITVKEIKVKTARKVMSNVIELFKGDVDLEALLNDKYDILVEISKDFIEMPDGKGVDDLTYGDIKNTLFPVFQKVNESFLADLIAFAPTELMSDQTQIPSEDSIKPS